MSLLTERSFSRSIFSSEASCNFPPWFGSFGLKFGFFSAPSVDLTDAQWWRPPPWDLTWLDFSYITTEPGTDLMRERFSHHFSLFSSSLIHKPFLCYFSFFRWSALLSRCLSLWFNIVSNGVRDNRARIFSQFLFLIVLRSPLPKGSNDNTNLLLNAFLSPSLCVSLVFLFFLLPQSLFYSTSPHPPCLCLHRLALNALVWGLMQVQLCISMVFSPLP